MTPGTNPATEREIPALSYNRRPLLDRARYDFTDYGFILAASLSDIFETIPMEISDQEAFQFLYPKDDLAIGKFSLFNFHCFLKYTGSVEDFARSRGASVQDITLDDTTFNGVPAKIYHRTLSMKDLFEGASQVIDVIGVRPDMVVADSHLYFIHRHAHFYSGMIHEPGDDDHYEALRLLLITGISLVR